MISYRISHGSVSRGASGSTACPDWDLGSQRRSPWATGPSQLHLAARRDTEYGLAPNWDRTQPPGLPEVSLTTGDTVRR